MAISAAVKQKRERANEIIRGTSGEPNVTMDKYDEEFVSALNWYNCNCEEKEIRKYLDSYLKKTGEKQYIHAVNSATFLEIKALGVIARLTMRGQYIDLKEVELMACRLDALVEKYTPKTQPATNVIQFPPQPSIQDRLNQHASDLAALIEVEIDNFVATKKTSFSMKGFLQANQVSSPVARKLGEIFKPLLDELTSAYNKEDGDLVEGYSNFTKSGLKKFVEFMAAIVNECTQQVVSANAQRKPRIKKPRPPSKIVGKLKFKKEDPDFALKSIDPAKIVGCYELWTYNVTNRKMTVYRACNGGQLTVRGTAIVNYDINTSEMRTIRKPEQFLKSVKSAGKRAMNNAWKELSGKPLSPRGRINGDTILLAVY